MREYLTKADLITFDLEKRTVSIKCVVCRWRFRCPVEQLRRVMCHACESQHAVREAKRS